jgi:hypothetical protein
VQEQWANEGVKALQDIHSRVTAHKTLLSLPTSQPFEGPPCANFLQQKKVHSRTNARAMTSAEMIDRIEAIRGKADEDRAEDNGAIQQRAQIEAAEATEDLQMDVHSENNSQEGTRKVARKIARKVARKVARKIARKVARKIARKVARKMMYGPASPTSITTIYSTCLIHHYARHSLSD